MTAIRVLAVNGIKLVLPEVIRGFERDTGNTAEVAFDEAGHLRRRISGGERFDVAILPRAAAEALGAAGTLAPGRTVDLVHAVFGLGVRAGMPRPGPTPGPTGDAFRSFLLSAQRIVYTDPATGGVSGVFFARVADELAIGAAVAVRGQLTAGVLNAEPVARGEADIAVQMKHELLAVPGIEFVPFPPPYADAGFVVFSAGLAVTAPPAAGMLLDFLHGPSAAARFRASGLDPA